MKRVLSLSLMLLACNNVDDPRGCPAGYAELPPDEADPLIPSDLEFVGVYLADELRLTGDLDWYVEPLTTAIGGTQPVMLRYIYDGAATALDWPYIADDGGGEAVQITNVDGAQVTVRGVAASSNYLRVFYENTIFCTHRLMDAIELTAAPVNEIDLVPLGFEKVPANTPVAWAPGIRDVGVALYGNDKERLIDTSMQIMFAGAERVEWDTLRIDARAGSYKIAVTAGDKPTTAVDFIVVDHADSIAAEADAPTSIAPNVPTNVCFQAMSADRYVAGLTWTFSVDGQQTIQGDDTWRRNCIAVSTRQETGSVSVTASAGGQSVTVALAIAN